jgi:NADH:ubiquinone oxidoreductase subunit K
MGQSKLNRNITFKSLLDDRPWVSLGFISASFYFIFRLATEVVLRIRGVYPSGVLQYDSFYYFSFARELARHDNWIFFHNPFGVEDSEPHLVSILATLLRVTKLFWESHLFEFDLTLGSFFSLLNGLFFGRVLFLVSQQIRPITFGLGVVAFTMGGVGFLSALAFDTRSIFDQLLFSYWGTSWFMNNIATWEILFHALFWLGVVGIIQNRMHLLFFLSILLSLLHPFTSYTLLVFLLVYLGVQREKRKLQDYASYICTMFVLFIGGAFYSIFLPSYSKEGKFLNEAYISHPFSLDYQATFEFLLPSIIIFFSLVLMAQPSKLPNPKRRVFFVSFVALIGLSLGNDWGHFVPQPAHWLRVYPIGFLLLAGAASSPIKSIYKFLIPASIAFLVGLADTSINCWYFLLHHSSPVYPATLDRDTFQSIDFLKTLPPNRVIVIRECGAHDDFPGLEYSISALTNHEVEFGHVYFSKHFNLRDNCKGVDPFAGLKRNEILILPHKVHPIDSMKGNFSIGRYEIKTPD